MTTYIKKSLLVAFLEREKNVHGSLYREMMTQTADTHDPLERFTGSVRESLKYVAYSEMLRAVEDGSFDVSIENGEERADVARDMMPRTPKPKIAWDVVGMDDEEDNVDPEGRPVHRIVVGKTIRPKAKAIKVIHPTKRSWWSRLWSWLTFRQP